MKRTQMLFQNTVYKRKVEYNRERLDVYMGGGELAKKAW